MDLQKDENDPVYNARLLEEANAARERKAVLKKAALKVLKVVLYIIGTIVLLVGGCLIVVIAKSFR